jgi:hypothetical protein
VADSPGWNWTNDRPTGQPKWGCISATVGSTLKLKFSTQAPAGGNESVVVQLGHLSSYEHMGKASVT